MPLSTIPFHESLVPNERYLPDPSTVALDREVCRRIMAYGFLVQFYLNAPEQLLSVAPQRSDLFRDKTMEGCKPSAKNTEVNNITKAKRAL